MGGWRILPLACMVVPFYFQGSRFFSVSVLLEQLGLMDEYELNKTFCKYLEMAEKLENEQPKLPKQNIEKALRVVQAIKESRRSIYLTLDVQN